jgi:multidrug efflux pump subunit AcrA (membrane-fusion protein)
VPAADADERLRRLDRMVEEGIADLDEALKERIAALKATRDAAQAGLDRLRLAGSAASVLTPERLARFSEAMRHNLQEGAIAFRKTYLGSLVDRIEVDDEVIRIIGRKDVLEQAVMAGGTSQGVVRGFVRYWRLPAGGWILAFQ